VWPTWRTTGHGQSCFGQETQESPDPLLINPAQGSHAGIGAKLAKQAHIGCAMPLFEKPKTPPGRRLWKQAHDGIETVRRTQHGQPMNPPKLGGAKVVAAPLAAVTRKQAVDELVRHIG
jgi:hypothetical protein